MSIPIIDTLKPMGDFPAANAHDIQVSSGKRLDEALNDKANKATTEAEIAKFNSMFALRED